MKWLEKLALAVIVIIAGSLRLGWLGVNSFGYDEARLSLLALEAKTGNIPLIGLPSSGGLPNFPAAAWLLTLPYLFTHDPLIVTLLLALLNSVVVLGVWWLGRMWLGRSVGILAAFLAATSPYLVLYSRNLWAQNVLPTMAILWAVALSLGWQRGSRAAWGLAGFLATFAVQVHFAGAVLIAITLALGIGQGRALRFAPVAWRWLIGGAIAGGLLALPTVIHVWCCQTSVQTQLQTLGQKTAQISADAAQQAIYQASSTQWQNLLLGETATPRPLPDVAAQAITLALLALGGWAWWRNRKWHFGLILLWAGLPMLAFTRHITPVNPQYLILGLPAFCLWLAGALRLGGRGWQGVVIGLCVLLSLNQTWALAADLTRAGEEAGGIGTPLYYPRRAIYTLRAQHPNQPIVVYTEGDDPATQGDPAVFEVLLWGYPHRVVDGRYAALIPNSPAQAVLSYETLPALPVLQALGASDERFFARRRNEPLYVTERLDPNLMLDRLRREAGFSLLPTPIAYDNGIALLGWRWHKTPQNRWRISSIWRVDGAPNDRSLHLFHHVRAGNERQLIAQEDVPMSSGSWQVGDTVIVWADFKPDPKLDLAMTNGPVQADIGIYRNPGLQRIAVAPQARHLASPEPTIVTLSLAAR